MAELSVNPALYDFLKESECKLYTERNQTMACVFVDFDDLQEFVRIVGTHHFDESGIKAVMKEDYLAIELNDFFEELGQSIVDYKAIFDDTDWDCYYKTLKEEYGEEYPDVFR